MLELSDIQSSQEVLQDYYAQLRAQNVTPAWIGGGISIEPRSKAVRSCGTGVICAHKLCERHSWWALSKLNAAFCA